MQQGAALQPIHHTATAVELIRYVMAALSLSSASARNFQTEKKNSVPLRYASTETIRDLANSVKTKRFRRTDTTYPDTLFTKTQQSAAGRRHVLHHSAQTIYTCSRCVSMLGTAPLVHVFFFFCVRRWWLQEYPPEIPRITKRLTSAFTLKRLFSCPSSSGSTSGSA